MAQIAYRKVCKAGGLTQPALSQDSQSMQAEAYNLHPFGGVTENAEVRKEVPEGNTVG
jgi:hypothetical protein